MRVCAFHGGELLFQQLVLRTQILRDCDAGLQLPDAVLQGLDLHGLVGEAPCIRGPLAWLLLMTIAVLVVVERVQKLRHARVLIETPVCGVLAESGSCASLLSRRVLNFAVGFPWGVRWDFEQFRLHLASL